MKLIIALVLSLGLAQTASAGFGDFFKTKPISKRMLNTVIKNHLIVADVVHPAQGLKLFDACFNGENFVSKTDTRSNRCVEREWTIDEEDKGNVSPQDYVLTQEEWEAQGSSGRFGSKYTPMCSMFEKYIPSGSINRTTTKEVNCRWVAGRDLPSGHPQANKQGESGTMYRICNREKVATTFPLTQTIEVHNLYDNFSDRIYWNPAAHQDRAQPGYRKFLYTIPMCDELGDDDLPDTKD